MEGSNENLDNIYFKNFLEVGGSTPCIGSKAYDSSMLVNEKRP